MTLHSMTGFGRSERREGLDRCVCDVRSVNSRFLEIHVRLPKGYLPLETQLQQLIRQKLSRGKVDVHISLDSQSGDVVLPTVNDAVVMEYINIIKNLTAKTSLKPGDSVDALKLLHLPGVLSHGSSDTTVDFTASPIVALIEQTTSDAVSSMIKHRIEEGTQLKAVFFELLTKLENNLKDVKTKLPGIHDQLAKAMHAKIDKFLGKTVASVGAEGLPQISQDRILQEIAIAAEKTDIEEEIVRFEQHINAFKKCIGESGSVGKRLDFLCQEMHREVNTMSSKLSHIEATSTIIDVKQLVEQVRQQVQNIE